MIPKACRPALLIDGQPTVEIDISACYLTLAHGRLGIPLPDVADPYEVNGIPRIVVKAFVNTLLGAGRPPIRWESDHRRKFEEAGEDNLTKRYPMKVISPKIMGAMPILQQALDAKITWAELLFDESEIVLATLTKLAFEHDICALPMHDAIRVPVIQQEIAFRTLSDSFQSRMGVTPKLEINL